MKKLVLTLPENVELDEKEAKFILAGELYKKEKITLGQAAQIVGVTKKSFIELMGLYGFSVFSDKVEDLIHDIENA